MSMSLALAGLTLELEGFGLGLGDEEGVDWALVVGLTTPYDGFDQENGSIEIVHAHPAVKPVPR